MVVQIGNFSFRTEISRLTEHHKDGRREPLSGVLSAVSRQGPNVSRVDLRGMTKEEALMTLDKYIDDALLAAIPEITIIHGKGTGTLRQAVEEYLKSNQNISPATASASHRKAVPGDDCKT